MKKKFGYGGMREEGFKLFYDLKTHTWKRPEDCYYTVCSLHNNICSLRAAKKHLRRYNEIPKGTVFVLESMHTEQLDIRLTKKMRCIKHGCESSNRMS